MVMPMRWLDEITIEQIENRSLSDLRPSPSRGCLWLDTARTLFSAGTPAQLHRGPEPDAQGGTRRDALAITDLDHDWTASLQRFRYRRCNIAQGTERVALLRVGQSRRGAVRAAGDLHAGPLVALAPGIRNGQAYLRWDLLRAPGREDSTRRVAQRHPID